MNLCGAVFFYLLKTNHTMDLTAGETDTYRVLVYCVATRAEMNKMNCGLVFSE